MVSCVEPILQLSSTPEERRAVLSQASNTLWRLSSARASILGEVEGHVPPNFFDSGDGYLTVLPIFSYV